MSLWSVLQTIRVKPCPFCGAMLMDIPVRSLTGDSYVWEHPRTVGRPRECIMEGIALQRDDIPLWNRRWP